MRNFQLRMALLLIPAMFTSSLFAQNWVKMMQDPSVNFYDAQKAFYQYYQKAERQMEKSPLRKSANASVENEAEETEVPGLSQFKRWEWFMQPRVASTGERFSPDATWQAMEKYRKQYPIATGTSGAGNWTLIGPSNTSGLAGAGRICFLRVHPTDPNTLYLGAPSGGLWKSTDGGSTWAPQTDQLPSVIGCSDLAFDPNDPNIMYLVTGDKDHGDNYAVGLLKSTDGGATWNTTGLSLNAAQYKLLRRVLVDPSNGNNILVAGSSGVFRSTDGGATFTHTQTDAMYDMEFKPGASSTVYACGTTFYKSTNGGATWAVAGSGLAGASTLCRMEIAVTAADPNVVYLNAGLAAPNYGEDGFYKSTNSGANFTKQSTPAYSTNAQFGTQEWYDLPVAASPSNASEVMIGGQIDFLKSTDGGATWSKIATSTHVDYHEITYATSSTVYLGSDGGVWKSTDDGANWTNLNHNLVISQMYGFGQSTTNANIMINGWQDNGTNVRGSAGTWSAPLGGDGMLAFVDWNNDQNMWGSQYNGSLYRSVNGGAFSSMSGINDGATCPWVTPWIEDPVTAGTVYAGCANVWKATAGTFSKLGANVAGTNTISISAIGVSPANTQVVWAAKGGTLYKTTNGGTSWAAITASTLPSGTISDIECHPTDANKVWVTYSGFSSANKVFQTTDQGVTWTNLASQSLPNVPVDCIKLDKNGNDALYVGTDVGVFFKDASMNIWQPFSNGLPNVIVTQLEIFYSGSKIRASTFGRGMWESTLYQPGAYAPSANFAADKIYGCPGLGVQFTDYSAGQPTSWSWTFAGGNPATSTQQNPFVIYNTAGTYSVSLTVTNAVTSDTKTYNSYITVSASPNAAPAAAGKNYCGPSAVSLSATPSASGTVHWWNQPTGGTILGTGNNYTTPTITGSQTYYVDEAFPSGSADNVGELDKTIGAGGMFSANDIRGLYFDVAKPIVLNSVQVYCNSAGKRTIQILDANGNLVTDTTLNIPANANALQTVTINRTVYPGKDYFIKFSGTVDCYRNTAGAIYPYTSSSGDVTITNSNAGSAGYYYFFYNWAFTEIICNTARTAVTVNDTCNSTGVADLFASNHLDVYPNPNNGEFTLSFNVENNDNYQVNITNALGQSVYREKLDHFSGIYSKKIDIASYEKGVYMINVTNSKNQAVKRVLVY